MTKGFTYYLLTILLICNYCASAQTLQVEPTPVPVAPFTTNSTPLIADTNTNKSPFIIGKIFISGNKKTKPYMIERELTFKEGDTVLLNELVKQFEFARQQLYNTRLFNEVIVALKSFNGFVVDIQIEVKERWYLFPIPYFKPIDRNLSAWADKGYSVSRINYGLKLSWFNVSGRNDKLRFWLVTGYTQQIELSYEQPAADKSLKHGYGGTIKYSTQKELNVNTIGNDQVFLNADSLSNAGKYLNYNFSAGLVYFYRPGILSKHTVRLGYSINKVDTAVVVANPQYFNNAATRIAYPELIYVWEYNKMDYNAYPQSGVSAQLELSKRGINSDMNLWQFSGRTTIAKKLKYKSSFTFQAGGVLKLPLDQPYINQRMFGYGDYYLRGYEKYVIDGVASMMVRNTFRKEFLNFDIKNFRKDAKYTIPFHFYAKVYTDMGYAYSRYLPANSLSNQMLYTWGAGIDVVTLYDLVFRFEYSFNQKGENGFFFHVRNDF